MTNSLPSGTVTFLFTDIEGSTKLAQEHPDKWETLQHRHHAILQSAMDAHNGYVFQIIGDAFCVAFNTANEAILSAIKSQTDLHAENWGDAPIKVRMGIHTGQAKIKDTGDYQGYLSMSRVQRLVSAGHGGQILISMATQELIRDELPENVSLRDMGERRLKDLIRPEHIYQLDIAGLPVEFAALKTLDKYRHNLPTQMTSFIGREKEMAEIKQALAEHRLVTLTGSGGAGKTRLSLQVAADSLDQFPNGIWFVELAPLTDPDLIPQTILTAAEMQTQQGRSPLESLTDFLREKTSLLVLDNCEHLIDACAKIADTLLNAAPNLKILASSREALGVKGEQSWRVPSLSAPDVKHLPSLEQLSQYEAVRLFIDRALLAQPHFAITNENAPAIAQICHRLDGIPLAIELAAARSRMLSAEQIAERLDDRFRLLTGGSRTALPRQQTLRALIDWSYDLLSENERTLLCRLAVFSGGCTVEAVEQVCADAGQDVLDLLTHLVDKSLLAVDEQPGRLRYRLLETVRQYAREKMAETSEGENIRNRHLDYFLKFAEEAAPHLVRKEQLEWFQHLELDHENLRAALEWATESEHDDLPEAGLRLVNALASFWLLQGYWTEGREWTTRALAKGKQPAPTVAQARAFVNAASYFLVDDNKKTIELCDESLALGRELGDKVSTAEALLLKGASVRNIGDNLTGKSLLEESLNLFRELGDKRGVARAIYHIGYTALKEYDFSTARQCWEECLSLSKEVGDRRFTAIALMSLGGLAMERGDWSAARTFIEESLSLGRELGDKHGLIMYLYSLGMLELGQGEYQQAQNLIEESLAVAQELGSKGMIMDALTAMGITARYQSEYDKATRLQKEVLAYSKEVDSKNGIAYCLYRLGELERLQDNNVAAGSALVEAMKLAKEIDDRTLIAPLLEEFAGLGNMRGQTTCAAVLFGVAEALRESIHIVLLPVEKIEVDKIIAAARAQLDEAIFNAAWAEGRAMKMEEAIEYALNELGK